MALTMPPYSPPSGRIFSALMSCYNRRFAAIAKRRRKHGLLGRTNKEMRCLLSGFTLERKDMFRLFGMLFDWMKLELREGFYTWFTPEEEESIPRTSKAEANA
jgi:hypothetical protein